MDEHLVGLQNKRAAKHIQSWLDKGDMTVETLEVKPDGRIDFDARSDAGFQPTVIYCVYWQNDQIRDRKDNLQYLAPVPEDDDEPAGINISGEVEVKRDIIGGNSHTGGDSYNAAGDITINK